MGCLIHNCYRLCRTMVAQCIDRTTAQTYRHVAHGSRRIRAESRAATSKTSARLTSSQLSGVKERHYERYVRGMRSERERVKERLCYWVVIFRTHSILCVCASVSPREIERRRTSFVRRGNDVTTCFGCVQELGAVQTRTRRKCVDDEVVCVRCLLEGCRVVDGWFPIDFTHIHRVSFVRYTVMTKCKMLQSETVCCEILLSFAAGSHPVCLSHECCIRLKRCQQFPQCSHTFQGEVSVAAVKQNAYILCAMLMETFRRRRWCRHFYSGEIMKMGPVQLWIQEILSCVARSYDARNWFFGSFKKDIFHPKRNG